MGSTGLQRLKAWSKAQEFAVLVYKEAVLTMPQEEKWGLANQLRRSAASIPANIAEGYGRFYFQETIRFCYYSRGSLEETLSHLMLAKELSYLPENTCKRLIGCGDELERIINGYIQYLKRSRQGANEPGASYPIHESTTGEKLEEPAAFSDDTQP